jgi:hypothetical protein
MNIDRFLSIAATVVSILSASFALLQYQSSERQLRLNAQQIRPHVSYTPTFFPEMQTLRVQMYLQNQSQIPANVLYADMAYSVNNEVAEHHYYSRAADIIYQEKAGASTLPTVQGAAMVDVLSGKSLLRVGTCAIYTSTSHGDDRRWLIRAIHEFTPGGSALPARRFVQEDELAADVSQCSAKHLLTDVRVSDDQTGISFEVTTPRQ